MNKAEQDLTRVLQYMQEHALKLSRRARDYLLKEFPSLGEEITKTSEDQKENSKQKPGQD